IHSTSSATVHRSAFAKRLKTSSEGFALAPLSRAATKGCLTFSFLASATCVRPRAVRIAWVAMSRFTSSQHYIWLYFPRDSAIYGAYQRRLICHAMTIHQRIL